MDFRRDDYKRIVRAPAKLNLFLEVLGRRDDGFHDVETLMVPIRLSDSLSLLPIDANSGNEPGPIRIEVRSCLPIQSAAAGDEIPVGGKNLVVRALELLQQQSGCKLGARVELVKRIPIASGLGGGSSDAAAALQLANRAWNVNWGQDRLANLAAELGSDVPFFLGNGAAIARGRGERIESRPQFPTLHFVIVRPPEGLRTENVYGAHAEMSATRAQCSSGKLKRLIHGLATGRPHEIWQCMHNSLQKAAAALSPWVDKLRSIFSGLDCLAHQLSGSGSAYFGVCRHAQHARRLASFLRTRQLGLVYATRSCQ